VREDGNHRRHERLLERKGEPTLLVTTRGFRDALRIAYQNRPRLFDRHIVLPELLYSEVIEAHERVGAHGDVLEPLDEAHLRAALAAAHGRGLRSVAIVFLHGYRYTAHEQAATAIARETGFRQVSTSHQTSPDDEAGQAAATPPWSMPTCRPSCAATWSRSPPRCRA
jgi:5-oxoprolinase (ATP-hydrolysing)